MLRQENKAQVELGAQGILAFESFPRVHSKFEAETISRRTRDGLNRGEGNSNEGGGSSGGEKGGGSGESGR